MAKFFLILIVGIFVGFNIWADAPSVVLEYPKGRFQEDKPPMFFRWSLDNSDATSITLKVFQLNSDGSYTKKNNLIARFDLHSDRKFLPWAQEALPRGNYIWTLEGYNEISAKPLFYEEISFNIVAFKPIDLRTRRIGIQLGFSRGQYAEVDPFYNVEFKTTPTLYGLLYRGGSQDRIWDLSAMMSDFTLRGIVKQTITMQASYSYRLNDNNSNQRDFFLGPLLRTFTFSRAISEDGTNLIFSDVSQFSPGLVLSAQFRLDGKMIFYSQLMLDIPIFATQKLASTGFSQASYGLNNGLIFGQFWPLAFSGELQYRVDKSSTFYQDYKADVNFSSWSFLTNLVYTF